MRPCSNNGNRRLKPVLKDGRLAVGVGIDVKCIAVIPFGCIVTASAGCEGRRELYGLEMRRRVGHISLSMESNRSDRGIIAEGKVDEEKSIFENFRILL